MADVYNIQVSNSCIDRVLRNFHYTIKKVDTIPDARNRSSTIEQRFKYSIRFRDLEQEIPIENFIFVDEVGFSISRGAGVFFPGGANFKKRALFVKKALQQKSFIATMSQSN